MGTHSKAKKAPVGGGDSKLDHVRNDRIKEIINVESRIMDTVESRIWQWIPQQRRKSGRPPRCWKEDVTEAMMARGLNKGDWNDRKP